MLLLHAGRVIFQQLNDIIQSLFQIMKIKKINK